MKYKIIFECDNYPQRYPAYAANLVKALDILTTAAMAGYKGRIEKL